MKKLFKRLRNAAAGIAITMAAFAGMAAVVAPQPAYAQPHDNGMDENDEVRRAFDRFDFVPGRRWYRLNVDLPASVVADVEREIGQPLCKIQVAPGQWVSNLKPCPENHPQMSDPIIGALNPRRDRDGPIIDFFAQNYAYNMPTRMRDLPVARAIESNHRIYLARLEERQRETQLAAAQPRVRPVEVARVDLPETVPLPPVRPVELAAVETIEPVQIGGAIENNTITVAALEPIPQITAEVAPDLVVPVRRVQTVRIRPATQVASVQDRQPVVTETAPVVVAAATVEQTIQTPVAVVEVAAPAPVLVAANDAAVQRVSLTNIFQRASRNSDLLVAANDTGPSLRAVPPVPANRDEQTSDKFNRYAILECAQFGVVKDGSPAAANDWVTPSGRNVEFEVYANGRFRVAAPALRMAA